MSLVCRNQPCVPSKNACNATHHEPKSVKKLLWGVIVWLIRKQVWVWLIDTIRYQITLPNTWIAKVCVVLAEFTTLLLLRSLILFRYLDHSQHHQFNMVSLWHNPHTYNQLSFCFPLHHIWQCARRTILQGPWSLPFRPMFSDISPL